MQKHEGDGLQIPFQYITLENGIKIIVNTIGIDLFRSPASVWKHALYSICIRCLDWFITYQFPQVLTQHHTATLTLTSNGTVKIQIREVKPIKH